MLFENEPVWDLEHWAGKGNGEGERGRSRSAPTVPPTTLRRISNELLPLCNFYTF